MKKEVIILAVLFLLPLILATNLEVASKPVQASFVADINEPAVFDLTIKNLDNPDTFSIYSLVGVDITPSSFKLQAQETKKITIKILPQDSLIQKRELPLTFIYKIKDSKGDIQEESLSINIIGLESMVSIIPEEINPESQSILIDVKNNLNLDIQALTLDFDSAFFSTKQTLDLKPKETKTLEITLDKEKVKSLNWGKYLLNTQMTFKGKSVRVESQINFLEQENIETTQNKEGFIINRNEIIKKNLGNVKRTATIRVEKDIISYIFTTYSIPPTSIQTQGLTKTYLWEKELIPNEELGVVVKTNWFFPLVIILIIVTGIIVIKKSMYDSLELRKKVSFVQTKGGQFALKVSLILKATGYVQRIKIVDKLPYLVELYDKFGAVPPTHIDRKNRRIEYEVPSLSKGESRVFTYIIYSKIGVVGKFELPSAHATYEKEGKVKETTSNRSFYIHEPKQKK